MNMYSGIAIGDKVICTSKAHLNKTGKVVRFVGDGGKRKFEIALGDGQLFSVARQSLRKVVTPPVVEGAGAHVRIAERQVATGMDEVILDEENASVNSSSSDEMDVNLDDFER